MARTVLRNALAARGLAPSHPICFSRRDRRNRRSHTYPLAIALTQHVEIRDDLEATGRVIFRRQERSVVVFRDHVLTIQRIGTCLRIRSIKAADRADLNGDLDGMARRINDTWVDDGELRARSLEQPDPEGERLKERLCALFASAVPGVPGFLHAVRPMASTEQGVVKICLATMGPEANFLSAAAKHAIRVAGHGFKWTLDSKLFPELGSSWQRVPLSYWVFQEAGPASATLRLLEMRAIRSAAVVETRSWLEATDAPSSLVRRAGRLVTPDPG